MKVTVEIYVLVLNGIFFVMRTSQLRNKIKVANNRLHLSDLS